MMSIPCGEAKDTAIHLAALNGQVPILDFLVRQKNVSCDRPGAKGRTPLHSSSARNHLHASKYLLEQGGSVDFADQDGCTPLHLACAGGHTALVRLLCSHGASIHAVNARGETPLDVAEAGGWGEAVASIVSHMKESLMPEGENKENAPPEPARAALPHLELPPANSHMWRALRRVERERHWDAARSEREKAALRNERDRVAARLAQEKRARQEALEEEARCRGEALAEKERNKAELRRDRDQALAVLEQAEEEKAVMAEELDAFISTFEAREEEHAAAEAGRARALAALEHAAARHWAAHVMGRAVEGWSLVVRIRRAQRLVVRRHGLLRAFSRWVLAWQRRAADLEFREHVHVTTRRQRATRRALLAWAGCARGERAGRRAAERRALAAWHGEAARARVGGVRVAQCTSWRAARMRLAALRAWAKVARGQRRLQAHVAAMRAHRNSRAQLAALAGWRDRAAAVRRAALCLAAVAQGRVRSLARRALVEWLCAAGRSRALAALAAQAVERLLRGCWMGWVAAASAWGGEGGACATAEVPPPLAAHLARWGGRRARAALAGWRDSARRACACRALLRRHGARSDRARARGALLAWRDAACDAALPRAVVLAHLARRGDRDLLRAAVGAWGALAAAASSRERAAEGMHGRRADGVLAEAVRGWRAWAGVCRAASLLAGGLEERRVRGALREWRAAAAGALEGRLAALASWKAAAARASLGRAVRAWAVECGRAVAARQAVAEQRRRLAACMMLRGEAALTSMVFRAWRHHAAAAAGLAFKAASRARDGRAGRALVAWAAAAREGAARDAWAAGVARRRARRLALLGALSRWSAFSSRAIAKREAGMVAAVHREGVLVQRAFDGWLAAYEESLEEGVRAGEAGLWHAQRLQQAVLWGWHEAAGAGSGGDVWEVLLARWDKVSRTRHTASAFGRWADFVAHRASEVDRCVAARAARARAGAWGVWVAHVAASKEERVKRCLKERDLLHRAMSGWALACQDRAAANSDLLLGALCGWAGVAARAACAAAEAAGMYPTALLARAVRAWAAAVGEAREARWQLAGLKARVESRVHRDVFRSWQRLVGGEFSGRLFELLTRSWTRDQTVHAFYRWRFNVLHMRMLQAQPLDMDAGEAQLLAESQACMVLQQRVHALEEDRGVLEGEVHRLTRLNGDLRSSFESMRESVESIKGSYEKKVGELAGEVEEVRQSTAANIMELLQGGFSPAAAAAVAGASPARTPRASLELSPARARASATPPAAPRPPRRAAGGLSPAAAPTAAREAPRRRVVGALRGHTITQVVGGPASPVDAAKRKPATSGGKGPASPGDAKRKAPAKRAATANTSPRASPRASSPRPGLSRISGKKVVTSSECRGLSASPSPAKRGALPPRDVPSSKIAARRAGTPPLPARRAAAPPPPPAATPVDPAAIAAAIAAGLEEAEFEVDAVLHPFPAAWTGDSVMARYVASAGRYESLEDGGPEMRSPELAAAPPPAALAADAAKSSPYLPAASPMGPLDLPWHSPAPSSGNQDGAGGGLGGYAFGPAMTSPELLQGGIRSLSPRGYRGVL